jgi:hypothetical protein
MKETILLLAMLCIGVGLRANNHKTSNGISRLTRLLPDNITRAKVKDIFGEATYININNKSGEESWHYKTDEDADINIRWDMKDNSVKSLSYYSSRPIKQNWSNQYLALLEMGVCTPAQAFKVLGDPTGLYVRPDEQELKYNYADNTVELLFKDGVLANMHVSIKRK